jgi:hypothetical protein
MGRNGPRRGFRFGATPLVAMILLTMAACVPKPPAPPERDAHLLGCDVATRAEHVIERDTRLDPACTYTGRFRITKAGVTLRCRGATIEGDTGVGIEVSTPVDVSMSGVQIRDCHTRGFLNGMRVTRVGFRSLAEGHEYDHALSDVLIANSSVTGSRGVGIFVDGYVSDVTIRDTTVHGAGSSGIYLEAGSRANTVVGNVIVDNGYRENGPGGQLFELGGHTFRFWGTGREGLSVDGSYDNVVARNFFRGNSAGAIFLYTNCSEFVNQRPERFFQRRTKAERNLIERNVVVGGLNGVWVGSRMSENTFPMDCANPAYVEQDVRRITLDHAPGNTIVANRFHDVTYGVRVEDDATVVRRNAFVADGPDHHAVIVGTKWRTSVLARPVRDTLLSGNRSWIVGNTDPYRWIYGVENLRARANTALGTAAGVCEGVPIPINTFIFVLALALEDPPAPPTPTPDLTVPTIGALPPC